MDGDCPRCDVDHPRGAPDCHGRRVGKVFAGKYRVLRVIGAGGMGVVFEVEHQTLGRRSALKLLLGARSGPVAKERFKREAQRLAALDSPAIVRVFDAGHDEEGSPFLEMELLDGASLEDVSKGRLLPPARAAEIVRGALSGLEVAHAAGVIHRDIKPDNVFIVGDPQRSTVVKLLDFGIAKAEQDGDALTREEGAVLGTAYFMSPEQVKSSAGADARSDVYSMGATLFRALTGAYPVEPGPTVSVVANIVTGKVARHPRERVAAVPPWLDAVVARAMAPDPADRYAGACEMREALEAQTTAATTEADDDAPAPPPAVTEADLPAAPAVTEAEIPAAPAATEAEIPAAPAVTAAREPAATEAREPATARMEVREPPPGGTAAAAKPTRWAPLAGVAVVLAVGGLAAAMLGSSKRTPDLGSQETRQAATASALPAPAASPSSAPARLPPLAGVVALPGGTIAIGTPGGEQAAALARCKSELAIDARDCTPERLAREAARTIELGAYDLDALEVDNASFVRWAAGELASKNATLDAKGVATADGVPLFQTGTQHAGIDAAAGSLKLRTGFEKRPAVLVSWTGAARYCAAQGKRLPTEPEWEAAARDGRRAEFPWGDDVPACDQVAFGGSARGRCALRGSRDVGASPRDVTRAGVRDLGGNVMEWVDGPGDAEGTHPMRGGSWAGSAFEARTARRRFGKVTEMLGDVGFRCALSAPRARE